MTQTSDRELRREVRTETGVREAYPVRYLALYEPQGAFPIKDLALYHLDEADKPHNDTTKNSSPFIEMALVFLLLRNTKYASWKAVYIIAPMEKMALETNLASQLLLRY